MALRHRLRLKWGDFFKRLYKRYEDHGVANSAAALGYYFVFSLFPFLVFLATLTVFIPHVQASIDTLPARARMFLPSEAMVVIEPHLRGLVANSKPQLLTLGLAAAIYSASRGADAVRAALNRAYDVKESRPLWKTELLAFTVTIGGGLLLLGGIALLVLGGSAGQWAARRLSIADEYVTVLRWIRWPLTTLVVMLGAASTYYLLPDVQWPRTESVRVALAGRGVEAAQGQLVGRSVGLALGLEDRDLVDLAVFQPKVGGLFG
jgi:membrane protein